jgi:alpha-mannosidase
MNTKKTVHLICNAHLDPVWLWQWEEGAAEAISTFRVAADFCEKYDGFIFNHNEALLYEWVEEHEPQLFKRIQKLVQQGKWCIMGGWFLQPDCNMPCGESFVRQILLGRTYFKNKFGVVPRVAINFDPFGHTRGLVQIMAKSGYDAYIFTRPFPHQIKLPDNYFRWIGFDGSEVIGCRSEDSYMSLRGTALKKVEDNLNNNKDRRVHFILWGIGNHGGGPSKIDLENLNKLLAKRKDIAIKHSSADAFIKEFRKDRDKLPKFESDLNPWATGCYSSAIRIKQMHRKIENELFMTEKMMTTASGQNLLEYPQKEFGQIQRDLAFMQFHDILPGSSVQSVENDALRLAGNALEMLSRLKTRAFFALAAGQKKPIKDEIPVLVYNPHPFKVNTTIECEFQLPNMNDTGTFTNFSVYHNGKKVPSQIEKEESNLPLDWRKRIVISAELEPGCMNRFDCHPEVVEGKPKRKLKADKSGMIRFNNGQMAVVISEKTGLIEKYVVNGVDILKNNALQPLAIDDYEDPWGMNRTKYGKIIGKFKTLNGDESAKFAGVSKWQKTLPAVRVIEDGDARSVIEALLKFDESKIVMHYCLPKSGTEFEIKIKVYWNQKDTMLKLSVPLKNQADSEFLGQTAYGYQSLKNDGTESVMQKWLAIVDRKNNTALTCINDGTYSADYSNGELRLTLMRSPAYSAHPIEKRQTIPCDRFVSRIDQGERNFVFRFNAGKVNQILEMVDRKAIVANEKPFSLSFYPCGQGNIPKRGILLSDKAVQVTAAKESQDGKDYIFRLFEPTGTKQETQVTIPWANIKFKVTLNKFEIKTYRLNYKTKKIIETDLLENRIK